MANHDFDINAAADLWHFFKRYEIQSVKWEGNKLVVDHNVPEEHPVEQRWISVEEYLPSMEQLVLFVNKHRTDFCVHVGKLNFIGAKNTVYFQTRGCGRYHNAIAASHWMALPKDPRREDA